MVNSEHTQLPGRSYREESLVVRQLDQAKCRQVRLKEGFGCHAVYGNIFYRNSLVLLVYYVSYLDRRDSLFHPYKLFGGPLLLKRRH